MATATAVTNTNWLGTAAGRLSRWYGSFNRNLGVAVLILLGLAATNLTLVFNPLAGVIVNAAFLVLLIGLALWKEPVRKLAISVGILPVANMLVISLPPVTPFVQLTVFYVTILLLTLVYRFMFALEAPLSWSKLQLKGYAFTIPLMVVLGQLLGLLAYALLRHNYPFPTLSVGTVAISAVAFAFTEEMFFRGLVQQQGAKALNPVIAAILSATTFALVAVNHTTIWTPIFALVAGGVLAITYYVKPNLVLTTIINAAYKLTYLGLLATFVLHK